MSKARLLYTIRKYYIWLAVGAGAFAMRPLRAGAQQGDIGGGASTSDQGGTQIDISLKNPIKADTLSEFIRDILEIILTIAIPVVAFFIIYSGFLFVKARGNEQELQVAKKTFLWTVIGAAVVLGAWVLAQAIGGTVEEIRRNV